MAEQEYMMKEAKQVTTNAKGEQVFHEGTTLASADPAVYGRLMAAGKYEEAKQMARTPMYEIEEIKED